MRPSTWLIPALIFVMLLGPIAPAFAATPSVSVTYRSDQNLTLEAPAATNASIVTVKGTAEGAVSVTVSGASATIDATGAYSATVSLKAGANKVAVVATDRNGRTTKLTRTITLDTTAVPLMSTSAIVNWVSATTLDTKVTYNAKPVTLDEGGSYRVPLALSKAGTNTFRLDFQTAGGATYYHEMKVLRPLVVDVPTHTNLNTLILNGTTGSTLDVAYNGRPVTVDGNGTFRVVQTISSNSTSLAFRVSRIAAAWAASSAVIADGDPCAGNFGLYNVGPGPGFPAGVVCAGVYYAIPDAPYPLFGLPPQANRQADWSELPPGVKLPDTYGGGGTQVLGSAITLNATVQMTPLRGTVEGDHWRITLPSIAPGTVFTVRGTKVTATETPLRAAELRVPVLPGYNEIKIDYADNVGQPAFMLFGVDLPKPAPIQLTVGSSIGMVYGKEVELLAPPQIIDEVTFVPLRFLATALGADLAYDPETRTIKFNLNGHTVVLAVGKDIALVDEVELRMAAPAQLVNNSTMVPVRFVSENLGAKLRWNGKSRTITISLDELPPEPAEAEQPQSVPIAQSGFWRNLTPEQAKTALADATTNIHSFDALTEGYERLADASAVLFETEYVYTAFAAWRGLDAGYDVGPSFMEKASKQIRGQVEVLALLNVPDSFVHNFEVGTARLLQGDRTDTGKRTESPHTLPPGFFTLGRTPADQTTVLICLRFDSNWLDPTRPITLLLEGPNGFKSQSTFQLASLR